MTTTDKPLYIVLISIHGLLRGHDPELGCDADTGGQTKYVLDLARSLSALPSVERVDLITRRVVDPSVSADYAVVEEPLGEKARIIRIDAGPEEYIRKEELWEYLDAFADNLHKWLADQPRRPDVLHAHYADAGHVGVRLSHMMNVPLVYTGHSLGRDKRRRLVAAGHKPREIEERYNMARRIEAEEETLANARLVITSTRNEITGQYELYDYYQPDRMVVIAPGTDLKQFQPPQAKTADAGIVKNIGRFLKKPEKPIILALSRPEERKNILSLLDIYGTSAKLQQAANLVIVAGSREDIREMEDGPRSILTDILLAIDHHDLYGRVAIPKHLSQEDVPLLYRSVAAVGGVFVNPALTEPFGITLLEAAASGLPVVSTENGGPVDIIGNCKNGILVDPLDRDAIEHALLSLLRDPHEWKTFSRNGLRGVREHYCWEAHARAYMRNVLPLLTHETSLPAPFHRPSTLYSDRAIFTDIDQNLLGDPQSLKHFVRIVRENQRRVSFGIVTGRRLDSILSLLRKYNIPMPDVLITSIGTEIYYAGGLTVDRAWAKHINHLWDPRTVREILANVDGLVLQPKIEQSRFKVSYTYDAQEAVSIEEITALLRQEEQTVNVIHTFGRFIDIVPVRASKGFALRYFAQQWDIPLEKILVAGGSGADEDMMRGNTLAVVVANRHHEELSGLDDQENIYFAKKPYALGILEAMDYYDFYNTCKAPDDQ